MMETSHRKFVFHFVLQSSPSTIFRFSNVMKVDESLMSFIFATFAGFVADMLRACLTVFNAKTAVFDLSEYTT
jgi:hypothetical protein